jgi:hypothetical protein
MRRINYIEPQRRDADRKGADADSIRNHILQFCNPAIFTAP